MRLKIALLTISCLFFLLEQVISPAEENDIVKIKTFLSKNGVHPGETFKVALLAQIRPQWHIQAHELLDQFLIPTELILEEKEKIEVKEYSYPEPKLAKFEYSEAELKIYESEIIMGALIKTDPQLGLGQHKLKGELSYQACDDKSCLPPGKIEFEISFQVVPLSRETKAVHQDIFSKLDFKKDKNKN